MGAGLSQKQVNSRIYNRLQTIKRNLERAGVQVVYRNHQLIRFEAEGTKKKSAVLTSALELSMRVMVRPQERPQFISPERSIKTGDTADGN